MKADFLKAVRKAVPKRLIRLLKGCYDKLSDQGYTSLPKPDESESGQMVLK